MTDIDPFVLNLAQGGLSGTTAQILTAAVLIAASSNNLLKAGYALAFAGGFARCHAGSSIWRGLRLLASLSRSGCGSPLSSGFVCAAADHPRGPGGRAGAEIEIGSTSRSFTRAQLLADPDLTTIDVAHDNAYGGPMRYRALPLEHLLAGLDLPRDQVLESVASDGSSACCLSIWCCIPNRRGHAYLAIEPPDAPWPILPGGNSRPAPSISSGSIPQASGIRGEQWPYQVVAIRTRICRPSAGRSLASIRSLPADDPVRAARRCSSPNASPATK